MEQALTRKQARSPAQAVPFLIDFPTSRYWVDYDREADVLYIGFARPQQATVQTRPMMASCRATEKASSWE